MSAKVVPLPNGATFNAERTKRYHLWRTLDGRGRPEQRVVFVMLNPSTADEEEDDPTLRVCMGYGSRWGYGRLDVVNLHGWITPKPAELRRKVRESGFLDEPDNLAHVLRVVEGAGLVVCAWGPNGAFLNRDIAVCKRLTDAGTRLHVLELTKNGHPHHPLRLRSTLAPSPWAWRNRRTG